MKNLLTIAGSDCSGGAGIQADLKTFAAHGTYGMSVITAITAQNTLGVQAVQNLSSELVKKQIDAIFEDLEVHAVKIGMVSDTNIIQCISERLRYYQPQYIVVDPVMISKSGYLLLEKSACQALSELLIPLATLVTPNLPEAEELVGFPVRTKADMLLAAQQIHKLGATNVLIKGGHLETSADDLLFDGETYTWFSGQRHNTNNTHGTGCTLSSSLACNLAKDLTLMQAVASSKDYINKAIQYSLPIGRGCGPTHHFVDLYKLAGWL